MNMDTREYCLSCRELTMCWQEWLVSNF